MLRGALAAALLAGTTLGSATHAAGAAVLRTAVSDYYSTYTGDTPFGLLCTETEAKRGQGFGLVCFPLNNGEGHVGLSIVDKSARAVGARYEFDRVSTGATEVVATGGICGTGTLAVPANANEIRLFFGVVNASACATPSPASSGTVTATISD